jgi:tRNA1(Val) A37 N6-methylase TrmN6
MRIFPNGLEIPEKDVEILKETIDDVDHWVISKIAERVKTTKELLKQQWMPSLESDKDIQSYPKDLDKFIDLIMSRPWYKSREKRLQELKMQDEARFRVE